MCSFSRAGIKIFGADSLSVFLKCSLIWKFCTFRISEISQFEKSHYIDYTILQGEKIVDSESFFWGEKQQSGNHRSSLTLKEIKDVKTHRANKQPVIYPDISQLSSGVSSWVCTSTNISLCANTSDGEFILGNFQVKFFGKNIVYKILNKKHTIPVRVT